MTPTPAPQLSRTAIAVRYIAFVLLVLWLGGFTFYASIVVPIGTEVLGSSTAQGMITRQVTNSLNYCTMAGLAMMIPEFLLLKTWRNKVVNRVLMISIAVIFMSLATLFWLHGTLDSLIDVENQMVEDADRFYSLHRLYLWLSSVQWLMGSAWLFAALLPLRRLNPTY